MIDNIRIAVLSAYDEVRAFLDNDAPESMHYYDDELHEYLKGAASTYTFKADAQHPESVSLVEGNKLAFKWRKKDYYFNIVRVIRGEYEVEVEAYSLNLELLNERVDAYKAAKAMKFAEYLNVFDFEKVLTLNINEVADKTITHEWTGSDTVLARIYSLATVFDAEAEFVPILNNDYSLKKIVLNVYKKNSSTDQGMGRYRQDIILRYGKEVSGITKTSDITELYTAIRPTGKDGLMITSLNKTENDSAGNVEYQSLAGDGCIRAVQARDRFPSNNVGTDRYSTVDWSYDTDNVNTLYGQALAELKKNCVPQVQYEVEGYFDTDIGDTVTIVDEVYNPPLYLQARVTEQSRSFTDPAQNKTTFDNFKELQSQIDSALMRAMQKLIAENKVYTCSILSNNGVVFKNGEGSTTLTASVMDAGKDMTGNLTIQWTVDGEKISTSKSITVNAADISGKAVYRYEATDKAGISRGYAEATVANVNDGEPGEAGSPGADAYTLYLSTTSHVFNADYDGNLTQNISVSTVAVGYKGNEQITPVIGTLPVVSGFAFSLSGSTITITGKKGKDMPDNGVINIPVTLDGIDCTLTFTYAKVKDGYHGEDAKLCTVTGNQIMKYESGSTTPVPSALILTAEYQNTNHGKWQYRNEYDIWADFVPAQTNVTITIDEASIAWVGNTAVIRAIDSGQVAMDTITLAKLRDGSDGEKGDPGAPGTGITSVDVEYYLSTSPTEQIGGSWQTTAPDWVDGKYIWTKTITNLSNGSTSETNPVCITGSKGGTGEAGTGVESITEEYYLSTSKTEQNGGNWEPTPPTWSSGKYVWTRSKIIYKNPTSIVYTTPLCDSSWEAVNEMQISGRNLVLGTSVPLIAEETEDFTAFSYVKAYPLSPIITDDPKAFLLSFRDGSSLILSYDINIPRAYKNADYTLNRVGAYYQFTLTHTDGTVKYWYGSHSGPNTATNKHTFSGLNSLITLTENEGSYVGKYACYTTPINSSVLADFYANPDDYTVRAYPFNVEIRGAYTTGGSVSNLMLEKGNVPFDWTPAPEDIQHQIDSAITNVDVEYYLSTSDTSLAGGNWQTTAPTWEDGKYMWTRTKKTYADTTTVTTDPTCITGATGKGIKSIVEQYYQSDSATTQSGGEWVNTAPAWEDGKYVWTRSIITYTDDTNITTNPVCATGSKGEKGDTGPRGLQGLQGEKGDQGIQGPKGADGKTYYTWLKYADTPTTGMSDDPAGKAYIGLAYNKTTATESSNYSDYTWSLIKGAKGDQGVAGPKGTDGKTYYTWIKYATSASGANMSDDPAGKTYIGLAYNKTTATESTTASDYTWSLIKGDKGDTGTPGTGYTVLLSNESYSFAAGVSAAVAGSTYTNVNAWKNTTQVAATITKIGSTAVSGNATGVATGITGLTADVSGNGTTACKITFKATTSLTTKTGNVAIAITVDGKSFTKDFSFSLALKGATGDKGEQGEPTGVIVSATEPSNKFDGMLWKHTGTVSGLTKDVTYRWTGTKWETYLFAATNIKAESLSALSANLGKITAGDIKNSKNTVEFNVAEGWIESNTAEVSMMYGNGKVGYPAASFSEGGVYARLYADKNLATKINEVEVNGAGVFVNGIDIAGKIDELNRNLQPTVMFSGNRDIKQTGTWNDTLNFTNFASVRFTIRFQNQISVLWVRPMNDDTLIHTFSTAFYSNDGAFRILFGRLKFAGRYIERAEFKLSYNFGTPGDLGAGYIYVLEILGFKY
ncbi:MAG: phage tail spike protein [Clostridium sp.]|nr:phage tail spike protein [Clostridium sp.]